MIEPYKPLIDSGLAAFLIFDSTNIAPKVSKMPPHFTAKRHSLKTKTIT